MSVLEMFRQAIARITGEVYVPRDCSKCAESRMQALQWKRFAQSKHLASYPCIRAKEALLVDHVAFRHVGRVVDGEVIETYYDRDGKFVIVLGVGFHFSVNWDASSERPQGTRTRTRSHVSAKFTLEPSEVCKLIKRFS